MLAKIFSTMAKSASVTSASLAIAVIAFPTAAGMFGITLMTRALPPSAALMFAIVMPAMMLMISAPSRSTLPIEAATSGKDCGFTASKIAHAL